MLKHRWISHSVNSRGGPGKFCGTGRLIAPWRSAAAYDGTGWSGGPSEPVGLCPIRSIFFQSSFYYFYFLAIAMGWKEKHGSTITATLPRGKHREVNRLGKILSARRTSLPGEASGWRRISLSVSSSSDSTHPTTATSIQAGWSTSCKKYPQNQDLLKKEWEWWFWFRSDNQQQNNNKQWDLIWQSRKSRDGGDHCSDDSG